MTANRGYQLLHSDAFTAELEALGLDSSLFGAVGIPAPIFLAFVPRRAEVFDAQPHSFGTDASPSSYTRASVGMARDSAGVWQTFGASTVRPHYSSTGVFLGYLMEPAATNVFLNSDAPVTQNIALTTGEWTLSVHGTGLVTSSNGTGTATGHGAASEGTDITIDVTGAGTINFAVAGSPTLVQVENSNYSTSPIVTAGSSATRAEDRCEWAAQPAGYTHATGTVMIDFVPLYAAGAAFSGDINHGIVTFSNSQYSVLYAAEDDKVKSFDGTTGTSLDINTGGTVKGQQLRLANRFSGSQSELCAWNPDDGWRTSGARPYDGAWDYAGGSVLKVYRSGKLPMAFKNLCIWNRDISYAEMQRLFTPS